MSCTMSTHILRFRVLSIGGAFGNRLRERPSQVTDRQRMTRGKSTTPLQLYPGPICGPKGLCSESVSNYLSQLGLSFSPVAISHLP
jgi:hypothetical protein